MNKNTATELRRLRAILDTAADAIVGVSGQGRVHSANPAAERMFGKSTAELAGQPLASLLPTLDADALARTMQGGMLMHSTQSRIGRLEISALRHGDVAFPVEVLLGEITDDPEIRYTCIVRDLTEMQQAEEYMMLYGRAVDCTLNGISISDARRYPQPIVHVNPAFCRITGYAPHELLGRDASLLNGPLTDPDDLALLARTVQGGGELSITLKHYRKDGRLFHNKLSVSPVRDAHGRITHYINVVEDVSGQIEVKQRLIERTARLNATFDLSPDGFAVFDVQGELISVNPAFRAIVGELPTECSRLPDFDRWFASLCESPDTCRTVAQAAHNHTHDRIELVKPARKVIEREVRRNLGGSGETIVYMRDITHQSEIDRLKSEFLATAAHELRTPLASIVGFTELMLHRDYPPPKQKDLLATVHRQGMLLSGLIQELLDLSRIEARQGKDFHIVPTPLQTLVEGVLQNMSSDELGQKVQRGELPPVLLMADGAKMHQALTNLLSNAFKYSAPGSPVGIDAEVDAEPSPGRVLIHVRDQGIGMTPEQLGRAFERFYRADTSGNIPGTGLGLNLVKEIVELHGGRVSLSSTPGQGTVATVQLPLAPAWATSGTPV
ncbi:PAS domain S-box protein [uncultured Hydrogenophaga sp.]|uniref:PAS domain S-box protein n=1 Tax=uncultured Hydrogenophaga sp. TaxID=199683 RepID=UPI00265E386B|nr:PAS domain S-box protein [uncultured Hydrogenophaga sp.]